MNRSVPFYTMLIAAALVPFLIRKTFTAPDYAKEILTAAACLANAIAFGALALLCIS